jgi:hypothetical protein
MLKVLRRGSTRYLALSAILLTILLCLYYANYNATPTGNATLVTSSASASDVAKLPAEQRKDENAAAAAAAVPGDHGLLTAEERVPEADLLEPEPDSLITQDTCPVLPSAKTDVDTVEQFKKFEFQVRPNPRQMKCCRRYHLLGVIPCGVVGDCQ